MFKMIQIGHRFQMNVKNNMGYDGRGKSKYL